MKSVCSSVSLLKVSYLGIRFQICHDIKQSYENNAYCLRENFLKSKYPKVIAALPVGFIVGKPGLPGLQRSGRRSSETVQHRSVITRVGSISLRL